jgi:outer membrane cobalamin receptor
VQTLKENAVYGDAGDKSYEFEGAFLTYLNLNYQISKHFAVNLAVDNVLGTKHYAAAPYAESGWVMHRAPQALRKIFFGLKTTL